MSIKRRIVRSFCLSIGLSVFFSFYVTGISAAATPRISAGFIHTVALKSDGTLWTWGGNTYGQLGDGSNTSRDTPARVPGGGNTWVAVAAGGYHTVALKSDGTLWAWGWNLYGQLGDGSNIDRNTPVEVSGGGNTWVSIAAEGAHTVALKSDGTLWAWGWNLHGQLGDGANTDRNTPVEVSGGENTWVAIAAGEAHTVALKSDGTLWTWGWNLYGQLGDGSNVNRNTPVEISGGGSTWSAIAAGTFNTGALKSDGTLWVWGRNDYGQVGDGSNTDRNTPVQVSGGGNTWVAIDAGIYHTVGLKSTGTLWAWGYNVDGQLGDGTNTNRDAPVEVARGGNTWTAIAAGGLHTVALKSNGTLWTWGRNDNGQLGDGSTIGRNSPVLIKPRMNDVDFDGDRKTDIAFYRSSTGVWWITPSSGAPAYGYGWGGPGFNPVPGDYDGDGKTDIAIYDTTTGAWWIVLSSGIPAYGVGWGGSAFKPVPGNYDGDTKTDIAIYDTTAGAWWVIPSSGVGPQGQVGAYGVGWGGSGFKPVPGDYDGDGKTDIAIYDTTAGAWWIIPSSGTAAYGVGWGGSGFTPVSGDYDGDGKTDIAIYDTASGGWWIIPSSGTGPQGQVGAYGVGWGGPGFTPVPGDYDGDGKTDIAIYQGSTGAWWIIRSSDGSAYGIGWGGDASDIPLTPNPATSM